MNVDYLSTEDLLFLAADLGVSKVRDLGLLESAAARPRTSVLGEDAYPGLHEKAAVLLQSVVRNHPLVDGNKRLSWMSAFTFYGLNGLDLDAPEDDAYDLVIAMSTGALDPTAAAPALAGWTRPR
ncbi:type II toxin-antitoxin system death-on-curing family toxin [Actinokineospora auranticolor]|uniref:Death-on-curing protein n=1 Tax=Actinokineospora auranticolor TaxID=155976 RepID=A0A2S6GYF6_9PSEU|nr:type II toxin-antitoxin system death-on-curing family toxin [Actinokineospora auranticolor]PPK70200.1 death-on-curing protein [Actinokineospora auranticolor]